MMKYSLLKRLAALGVCCALATTFAFAASTIHKTVTIEYASIKLVVDGVEITPKDANGATVEPFILNGTTYLPVRAVGNAIGKQVSWDGTSKTVYLGDNLGQSSYLMDVCPPYESYGLYTSSLKMGGQNYAHGFYLYGSPDSDYAMFNLNGHYTTLEFDMGHLDGSGMEPGTYEFYLDGQLVKTISMDAEDRVQHVTLPLNHALQMKIVPVETWGIAYCFANITLK